MRVSYKISASILNGDFMSLGSEIESIIDVVDEIHLDVMDGVFVDNISFGIPIVTSVRDAFPDAFLDAHLMIDRPGFFWEPFCKAGSNLVTIHYEADPHAYIILSRIRAAGIGAGISLTPATDARLLEPIKEVLDRVLIMTVEPGFGGQKFIEAMLRKVEVTRKLLGPDVDVEVDGGVDPTTIGRLRDAGANVFVVGSYIFKAQDKRVAVKGLRDALA